MKEKLQTILQDAQEEINCAYSLNELDTLRVKYLGRQGILTLLLKDMKNLPAEVRPEIGQLCNEVKLKIEQDVSQKKVEIEEKYVAQKLLEEKIDITLPGVGIRVGTKHPLTLVIEEIKRIFIGLGFEVEEGPEIETDYYNFEGLNIPPWHPARDEWDSFYLTDNLLLRTHTSPVQVRVMEKRKPPLKVISLGRCYRQDALDKTHSHTFHQVEGFAVDKKITFGDLKGVLFLFAKEMFGEEVKMRFRPDYFPFTEPSADGAISCIVCQGTGCAVCGKTGWLEIFGCGMIHPQVLKNVGYSPKAVSGFAFGMGIERIAMLKYGIDDIRLFFENDIRFLNQFMR